MLARKFRRLAESELLPDIILCSMPTIELSAAAVAYGTRRGIPVVLDIRDLWPDIFLDIIPGSLHAAARLALRPYYSAVRRACRNASAIVASTPEYVEWGVSLAGRKASHRDKHFFHGYSDNAPEPEAARKAEEFWTTAGVPVDHSLFTVCFFGYFGRQFELETVIRAARSLVKRSNDFRFVLCGDGDRLGDYRRMAADCTNVVFPGFVGRAEIWTLMRRSCVGVAPYASSFPPSMTNKPIEYLSGGLPVVSTLKGTLEALLKDYECGISYRNGDAEGLARIFEELHAESDRLSRMRGNALRLFQEKFVADNVYGEMAQHLEAIARETALYGETKPNARRIFPEHC